MLASLHQYLGRLQGGGIGNPKGAGWETCVCLSGYLRGNIGSTGPGNRNAPPSSQPNLPDPSLTAGSQPREGSLATCRHNKSGVVGVEQNGIMVMHGGRVNCCMIRGSCFRLLVSYLFSILSLQYFVSLAICV